MSVSRINRIILSGALLSLAVAASGCSSIDRLSQIGEKPKLTEIENPTTQPGYKPVQMPMPKPEQASYNANSLWRNGSRAFFRDQRAARVGDILTVTVNITDKANIANETQRSRNSKEDFRDYRLHRIPDHHATEQDPARPPPDHGLDVVERRQGFGQPPGGLADQRRRRGHAGAAERQSRGRGQAGNPRQFRNPRTDRRRHRPSRRRPERQHHRTPRRSRRPASPMAAAARSPTCSNPATASR